MSGLVSEINIIGLTWNNAEVGYKVNVEVTADFPINASSVFVDAESGVVTNYVSAGVEGNPNRSAIEFRINTAGTYTATVEVWGNDAYDSREFTIEVVALGETIPSITGADWRKILKRNYLDNTKLLKVLPTPDNGHWAVYATSTSEASILVDEVTFTRPAAMSVTTSVDRRLLFVRYDENGDTTGGAQAFRTSRWRLYDSSDGELTVDADGDLYMIDGFSAPTSYVFAESDGTVFGGGATTLADDKYCIASLAVDGTWKWVEFLPDASTAFTGNQRALAVYDGKLNVLYGRRTSGSSGTASTAVGWKQFDAATGSATGLDTTIAGINQPVQALVTNGYLTVAVETYSGTVAGETTSSSETWLVRLNPVTGNAETAVRITKTVVTPAPVFRNFVWLPGHGFLAHVEWWWTGPTPTVSEYLVGGEEFASIVSSDGSTRQQFFLKVSELLETVQVEAMPAGDGVRFGGFGGMQRLTANLIAVRATDTADPDRTYIATVSADLEVATVDLAWFEWATAVGSGYLSERADGGAVFIATGETVSDAISFSDAATLTVDSLSSGSNLVSWGATVNGEGFWSAPLGAGVVDPEYPELPGDLGPIDILGPDGWPFVDPDPEEASVPTAPTPTTVDAFDEDTVEVQRFSSTDADGDGFYTFEVATAATGPWRSDGIVTPDITVTLDTEGRESDDLFVDATIVPTANWNGSYTFYMRVKKSSFPNDLFSPVVGISGTVTAVADAPSKPFPSRMPTVDSGIPAVGNFQFVDPDGSSWTVAISATKGGTYGSTLTLAGKGTLTVNHTSSAKTFTVRFDQVEGGYLGRYQFWAKVTGSDSLASEPVLITGVVSGAAIGVELQRISRTEEGVTITPLVPLTSLIELEVTEAIEGPGSATITIAATELARRAALLELTAAELADAGATEAVVSINSTPIFVGPVTGLRHDITNDSVSIYCTGLLGYFEARAVEEYDLEYTGVEQSAIVWDLIEREQAKDFGDLALTDGTTDTSENRTVTFTHKDTVASALYEIRDLLNGPEIWIDVDRVVRTALVRGQDRRGSIVFTPANTSRMELTTDWKVLANVVHVYGDGTGAGMSNGDSMARYGRMVRPIEAEKITVYGTALDLATKQVLNLKDLNEAMTITHDANPERPFTVLDYGVGDAVTVEADTALGRIVVDVRIVSRTIRLIRGTASSYEVELTVERIAPDGVIRGTRSDHNPDVLSQVYDALYR
jgi:hypothetical protein